MCLIPFTQRFDGKKADPKLPEKLREELPGVLAWAVEGCVAWVANGLGSSRAVDAATAEYRSETDVLDRFFEDACEFGPAATYRVPKKDLFVAWERWCDNEGADPGTQTAFTRTVGERGVVRGFKEAKSNGVRVWSGIKLANKVPPNDPKTESDPVRKDLQTRTFQEEQGHFPLNSEKFSMKTSRKGVPEKTTKSAPRDPELSAGDDGEVRWAVGNEETWGG